MENDNASSAASGGAATQASAPAPAAMPLPNDNEMLSRLTPNIIETYERIAAAEGISEHLLSLKPLSGLGENCYGLIMQITLLAKDRTDGQTMASNEPNSKEYVNILKMSPKNAAFRAHGRIVDLYRREVFMYNEVFPSFRQLFQERVHALNKDSLSSAEYAFDIVPQLLSFSMEENAEYLMFEDLTLDDYKQNSRTKMPTYQLVAANFRAIAKFHAMSFVLQHQKPQYFQQLVQQMQDNLFIANMEPITIEFGKKYIRKTRVMLENDNKPQTMQQIKALQRVENEFHNIGMQCVNGKACAPYAVICHGDFWNNNILYKSKTSPTGHESISAKLIDFQISRYASPVLDLVHYLFTCTDRELRKSHFAQLMDIYYEALTANLAFYGLQSSEIYPRSVFEQHLKSYGIFGLCMSAFSIPFFISNTSELPDLDEVATAIREISSSDNSDAEDESDGKKATARKELLDEYDLLTERTLPIFRQRMMGIVKDLEAFGMLEAVKEK